MISTINVTPLRQHNDWYFMLDSATPKMKRYGVNDSDSFSDWLPRRHRAPATLWNISLTETLVPSQVVNANPSDSQPVYLYWPPGATAPPRTPLAPPLLCSRLSSSEVQFYRVNGCFALWVPFVALGATWDVHLRLNGKRVVDFLLVLVELFER